MQTFGRRRQRQALNSWTSGVRKRHFSPLRNQVNRPSSDQCRWVDQAQLCARPRFALA